MEGGKETVSQLVIPTKPHGMGREQGSISCWDNSVFLDSPSMLLHSAIAHDRGQGGEHVEPRISSLGFPE